MVGVFHTSNPSSKSEEVFNSIYRVYYVVDLASYGYKKMLDVKNYCSNSRSADQNDVALVWPQKK